MTSTDIVDETAAVVERLRAHAQYLRENLPTTSEQHLPEKKARISNLEGAADLIERLSRERLPVCCVTGRVAGDGFACGDCDPCFAAINVPNAVKDLISERDEFASKYEDAMLSRERDTGVPEGFCLVPKEPTVDMAEVARDWAQRDWKAFGNPHGYVKYFLGIYRAMLSAAPQPPTVSTQGWQDISTAPRNGRWFLICREDEGPESYEVGRFDPQTWSVYEPAENGLYRKVERVVNEWRGFNNFHRATHWTALLGHPGDPDLSTLTRERDQAREALELAEPILAAVSMLLREDRILVCRDEILTAALQRARSVLHQEEGPIDAALSAAPAPEAADGERS